MLPVLPARSTGFTLLELAVVLTIVALLLGGLMMPLSAQRDARSLSETRQRLTEVRDALLGFAVAHDRLPCPASDSSNGRESFCTSAQGDCVMTTAEESPGVVAHGRCSNPYDGFVPAVSLGLSPLDGQGYALDGWAAGAANRLRYAIAMAGGTFSYTQAQGMKLRTMAALQPDLKICNAGSAVLRAGSATASCASNAFLAADAVAVIYSLGANAASGGTSNDERHNPNATAAGYADHVAPDAAFVNATTGPAFDDVLIWLSPHILYNRMVTAGKLP